MSKTFFKKSVFLICILLSAFMVLSVAVPETTSIKTSAYDDDDDDDFDDDYYDDYDTLDYVSFNYSKIKMTKGQTRTLEAEYEPDEFYDPYNESLKSSNKKVATASYDDDIDEWICVHAKNLGKATITYKCDGCSAKCKVTVNKMNYNMKSGNSKSLKKYIKYIKGHKKAKWKSSNKKIISVTKKGKIKAKKHGSATITAKIKGTKYKIKVYSVSRSTLKSKCMKALKKSRKVPKSLKIFKVKYPKFNKCEIYFSAEDYYGFTYYEKFTGTLKNGELSWYVD